MVVRRDLQKADVYLTWATNAAIDMEGGNSEWK